MGALGIVAWIIIAIVDVVIEEKATPPIALAVIGLIALVVRGCGGCSMIRANDYAGMIGQVEERVWTQDVQPKDPKHIRLVPKEMAEWLADKQLGAAPGAIGSQFEVAKSHMTLQKIKNELWYAAPLDFKDYGTWSSTGTAPGYVMVQGQDPLKQVVTKFDEKFVYMPGAYFSHNLERHLRQNGYSDKGLTDFTFEIDDNGQAWWTTTVFTPTIAWSGEKVDGLVIVNPTTGAIQFYPLGQVPSWVDRVMPREFVENYLKWRGEYAGGWWNSMWAELNITKPGTQTIVYGSDEEPYWVADVTSSNNKDQSLVGLTYVDTRTGHPISYRATGSTEEAVLEAVNNKVSFRKWHGASPVIYNIYGTMASIVPLLGESHTYQGVAIVKIDNMQVAVGDDQYAALREYQKLISQSGQQIAPELAHAKKTLTGQVDRFASEVKEKETLYFVHLAGVKKLFTGDSTLSPKLPLTKPGDDVSIVLIDSGEDVEPMLSFDNDSLPLEKSPAQKEVAEAVRARQAEPKAIETATVREKVKGLSDAKLQDLLRLREQQKSK
jgi:hypothetical protein